MDEENWEKTDKNFEKTTLAFLSSLNLVQNVVQQKRNWLLLLGTRKEYGGEENKSVGFQLSTECRDATKKAVTFSIYVILAHIWNVLFNTLYENEVDNLSWKSLFLKFHYKCIEYYEMLYMYEVYEAYEMYKVYKIV